MPIRSSFAFLSAGVALACLIQPASATTRQVGACTNNPLQYTTIQGAVTAANSGDKVAICPGSYPEQVTITKALTVEPVPNQQGSVSITLPTGALTKTTTLYGQPAVAQILVASPGGVVKFENITVDGTGFVPPDGGCTDEFLGIYYQNAGGTISGNTAQNQILPPEDQGCQDGEAIFVESQSGEPAVKITGNTVSDFDKNGITVSYAGADATISDNIVTGWGPTDIIAQNGIQVGYGATGSISGNQVSNLVYSPATYGSSAILLWDSQANDGQSDQYSTAPKITNNTITNSQYGIVLDAVNGTANKMVQIKSNGISGATFAGIGLYSDGLDFTTPLSDDYIKVLNNTVSGTTPYDNIDACSDHNLIKGNTVSDSGEGGIHLDALCEEPDTSTSGVNNSVSGNTIENNCVGILSGPAQGANQIGSNNFSGNTNAYVYNSDSYSCSSGRHSGPKGGSGSSRLLPAVQPR
jgi:nitrous oxidase accessory protein NosD